MPILIELFIVFLTIGIFCFGGGYAIIPFIQEAIVSRNWIAIDEFINMIAVAESTPGPISINTATFVGFKMAGLNGALAATIGLCVPAFVLVVFVGQLLAMEKGKQFIDRIMIGIRPVVVALIFAAALSVARTVLISDDWTIHYGSIFLAIIAFVAIQRKIHPIIIILLAAIVGTIF